MKKNTVLIMRPDGDDSSPADQTFAARLASVRKSKSVNNFSGARSPTI